MSRRIFVTGLWHETNTFAATPTDLGAFRAYQPGFPRYRFHSGHCALLVPA